MLLAVCMSVFVRERLFERETAFVWEREACQRQEAETKRFERETQMQKQREG